MTSGKRILHFIIGIFMILSCILLLGFPEEGYDIVIVVLVITLLIAGLRSLISYFTMTRFMVGGLMELYKAMIFFDFGLFVFNLDSIPKPLAILYIAAGIAFSGIIDILRSLDSKRLHSNLWKFEFGYGAVQVSMALLSLFFLHSDRITMVIYCVGLVHSAFSHIARALKKTAIVFIE